MIRKGMWVKHAKHGVGIANDVRSDGVEFHKVNPKGETDLALVVGVGELTQAKYADIPAARRSGSVEAFKALGYG